MARRSQETDTAGSLDLLLDTICNTFGGVLFLAILVVIMLQTTQRVDNEEQIEPESNQEALAELELELAATLTDLNALRIASEIQEQQSSALDSDDEQEVRSALAKTMKERDELIDRRLEMLQQLANQQSNINQIKSELESLDLELAEATEELSKEQEGLRSELETRSRKASLPRARSTSKLEVIVILRFGRVYFLHQPELGDFERKLNTDEFVILGEDSDYLRVIPKPYAGIPINQNDRFKTELSQKLKNFNSNRHYLAVGVWEDSFGEFEHFKSSVVEAGFQYRLIPVPEGETLQQGFVANPLVQ